MSGSRMIACKAGQSFMPFSPASWYSFGGMVVWPHWHVIIWGRLVVNWILKNFFDVV